MKPFPAHIRTDEYNGQKQDVVQTVEAHCRATAAYAREALETVGLGNAGYLAGLLHDCGKYTTAFSDYLWAAHRGKTVHRGSVNHTFAGVQYLFRQYFGKDPYEDLSCQFLAYAIGAHHGLFDLMKDHQEYGFPHRIEADNIHYEEAISNFLAKCADQKTLLAYFNQANTDIAAFISHIVSYASQDLNTYPVHMPFYLGMLTRLLLSAVIEGDRRDTAEFCNQIVYPNSPGDRTQLWVECLAHMEQKLKHFPQNTPIQQARTRISELCKEKALLLGGIYRLNLPTGGGKTLTSLRFALAHSAAQHKQRIFFVIPLLSIIDQNSKVIRAFLPREDILLEHHSNVVQESKQPSGNLDPWELLAESWSAPMIITTLVQMLNTLFSGKTSSIRRFQSLCDSVIIFDEVQTVPTKMLSLFNLAINFLSEFCGASVVLCSATQPGLESVVHPLAAAPLDLVPYDEALWAPFRRTSLVNAGTYALEELPSLILEQLSQHRSLLVICNKKDEAAKLYQALAGQVEHPFHLSASMCMAHRRKTLDQLSALLKPDSGVEHGILCISTQVIEAGVDISFDCVIRLLAGMDSAIQAAGRCNRNGEADQIQPVYLVQCGDEDLSHLPEMQATRNASEDLLVQFRDHPEQYGFDLSSDTAIQHYYQYLYRHIPQGAQDFPIGDDTILNMLSCNSKQVAGLLNPKYSLRQSFQSAGDAFQVFDNNTTDVLVPYGAEGRELLADLCSERAMHDLNFVKQILSRSAPYTISLLSYQRENLEKQDALYPVCDKCVLVLRDNYYHPDIGLIFEPVSEQHLEVNTCDFLI